MWQGHPPLSSVLQPFLVSGLEEQRGLWGEPSWVQGLPPSIAVDLMTSLPTIEPEWPRNA